MKTQRSNKGRITRHDQAWAAAHREQAARAGAKPGTSVVPFEPPQSATPLEVIPATYPLSVPLRFVQAALLTAGKGDIRYYLNGVYIHAVDGEVRVSATDGHRLIVSRFVPKDQPIPQWAEEGVIIPRDELAQAMPVLHKNAGASKFDCSQDAVVIEHAVGQEAMTLRTVNGFASFKVKPVDGKFPDYAKVLAAAGASLARGQSDAMIATAINIAYVKGAADVGLKLGAKAIHSFMGDGQAAALFTFDGAPDTVLIIMPMRGDQAVSDGVVRMLGSAGISGSLAALRAHVTRTAKALTLAKTDKEREDLEDRKTGFENRIAHLMQVTAQGPARLEHREAA